MLIAGISAYWWEGFWCGVFIGIVSTFVFYFFLYLQEKWKEERDEFHEWKKTKNTPEVVDAHFVTSKPRSTSPQLNSSTALVPRTSVIRRKP